MKPKNLKTHIPISALFTAVICIISQISFITPVGIPITMQVLAVALCGYVLGARWGTATVVTYILAGAVGLPVFSGFKGGIHNLFGPTGGFISGFIILSFLCGITLKRNNPLIKISIGLAGVVLCHLFGVVQYSIISKIGIAAAFVSASLPFLLKDVIFVIAAYYLSQKIKKVINRK